MDSLGLYIHIPFCKSKCFYCDFNSYSNKEYMMDEYVNCLNTEIYKRVPVIDEYHVKSIYIGGGTPTYLNLKAMETMLAALNKYITDDVEFTCEANPGTLTREKLKLLKDFGVNRLSMGLQSCSDNILKGLGRIHKFGDFLENYNTAREVGFRNINVDLMFSIQGQTLEDLEDTLDKVISINPEHISCYSLIIEEGTRFYEQYQQGALKEIDEELDREMYYLASEKLNNAGIKRYEISNYAKPGYECRHNIIYWKTKPYLGLGAGAHSYIKNRRFFNELMPEKYIDIINNDMLPVAHEDILSCEEMMTEYMFMGLRMVEGISIEEFKTRFGQDVYNIYGSQIERMIKAGLIKPGNGRLMLTGRGIDLSNQVFVEFI